MRFKTSVKNIQTFSKLTASLSSLGKVAWVRLDDEQVRFTIIPETGTQVWASLSIDSIFEDYTIQSNAPRNTINLELPLPPLSRALKSAINATSASIRLTKKDGVPVLSLTIITHTISSGNTANGFLNRANDDPFAEPGAFREESLDAGMSRDRETIVTQDIPVRVLTADSVEGIHEPRVREPDAHIILPSLVQLKAISDRFTNLAMATGSGTGKAQTPKLELAANMHGSLKLSIRTEALSIESVWTGLTNPDLDPGSVEDGVVGLEVHPSTKLRDKGPEAWSTVRIDGRDWGKVLSVGRLGGRVIACFSDDHALILYVYLSNYEGADESVLTSIVLQKHVLLYGLSRGGKHNIRLQRYLQLSTFNAKRADVHHVIYQIPWSRFANTFPIRTRSLLLKRCLDGGDKIDRDENCQAKWNCGS